MEHQPLPTLLSVELPAMHRRRPHAPTTEKTAELISQFAARRSKLVISFIATHHRAGSPRASIPFDDSSPVVAAATPQAE